MQVWSQPGFKVTAQNLTAGERRARRGRLTRQITVAREQRSTTTYLLFIIGSGGGGGSYDRQFITADSCTDYTEVIGATLNKGPI